MTSSVTFPLLATNYARAHKCRPQNCLAMCLNYIISFREFLPLMYCTILLGDRRQLYEAKTPYREPPAAPPQTPVRP
jgi:hypothetical protein